MSIAKQKYRKKEESILAAAEVLFLAQGYGATTMDNIAQTAKVTKQTVYRYYPSKKLLFTQLIEKDDDGHQAFQFGSLSVQQELQRYAESFITFHMAPKRLNLYRLMLGESKTHPEIADVFHTKAQPRWQTQLTDYLQQHLNNETQVKTYGAMFNALLLHQRTPILMGFLPIPNSEEMQHQAQLATTLFLNGVDLVTSTVS
jgi:TetR/AcrR family transcriptional repressor of mexJK operon